MLTITAPAGSSPAEPPTPALDDDATPAPSDDPTPAAPASAPPASSAPASGEARFLPGTVLAGRYRVVGLLGRGGMGEVYRADDLKLGQSVALKFLPPGTGSDAEWLERFLGEVRVALKITHPNVCRVYDIGEVDGAHYLSMEYIDGEDLSSLLRRIGRLPEDKAVQIARQLCAGLTAAHEQGILHRDLKPANVMLDGRGDVKITDFGLAGLAEGFSGIEIRAGTPAYMAPEQLSGKEVTARSDIYALGLVLYQLFTGKKAFAGNSVAELSQLQQSEPASPSSHVRLLDPAIEQVILRCLAPDPANRPASVLKVALGLPGADPLAAALAAGETPSPEMVAEAGDDSGLKPKVAVPIMVLTLVGLLAASWIVGRYSLLAQVPMELPPQVLAHRAQEIAVALGYDQAPADRAYRFEVDEEILKHLNQDPSPDRWDRLAVRPTAIYFWYRQSPRQLIPTNLGAQVLFNDPPVRFSGMANLHLSSTGKLRFFKAVPPQLDVPETAAEPEWSVAFEAAGLELASFTPTPPHWLPEAFCNQRAAWLGRYPDPPKRTAGASHEIRVEACAYNGKPVFFSIVSPWDRPLRQQGPDRTATQQAQNTAAGIASVALVIGAVLLVRHNLKLGRGDRRGASRLAAWVMAANMGAWLFKASHVPDPGGELGVFTFGLAVSLLNGGVAWMFYIALEPFVRQRWPESLVSWNRLLAGRFRDPLVGRHLLYGAALGVGMELLQQLGGLAPTFFGGAAAQPTATIDLDTLLGTRWVIGEMFSSMQNVIVTPMTYLALLVLFRVVLRNSWLALPAFTALFVFLDLPDSEHAAIWALTYGITWAAVGIFLIRFGLVSFMGAFFFASELLGGQPMTLDFSTWYAGSTLVALAAGVAVLLFAFRTSLGERKLVPESE